MKHKDKIVELLEEICDELEAGIFDGEISPLQPLSVSVSMSENFEGRKLECSFDIKPKTVVKIGDGAKKINNLRSV